MNREFRTILCSAVVLATLLTSGCGKSAKEKYGSSPFMVQSATAMLDALKEVLPKKDPLELQASCGRTGAAITGVSKLDISAASKAKVEKMAAMFDKEIAPTILSLQYDPAAIAKRLDEIRATLVEIGKEVK